MALHGMTCVLMVFLLGECMDHTVDKGVWVVLKLVCVLTGLENTHGWLA